MLGEASPLKEHQYFFDIIESHPRLCNAFIFSEERNLLDIMISDTFRKSDLQVTAFYFALSPFQIVLIN